MNAGALLTLLVVLASVGPAPAFAAGALPASSQESAAATLTAEVAVARAATFAPAVRQAREALREAELAAEEAGLKLRPGATLSGSAGVNQAGPRGSAGAAFSGSLSPRVTWNLSVESAFPESDPELSAAVRYTLWPAPAPGAWGEAERAAQRVERAHALLAQAEASAAVAARRAFERLQIAEARLRLAEEELSDAGAALQSVKSRFQRGEAPEIEALRAEIRYLEAQAALDERRRAAEEARRALGELVGLQADKLSVPPFAGAQVVAYELPAEEEAVQAALRASIDVADRQRELEAAQADLARVRSQNGLSLNLSGSAGKEPDRDPAWGVFLNLQYDLGGRGGLALARQRAARAVEQAERNLEEAKHSVASRVEEALRTLEADARTVAIRQMAEKVRALEAEAAREQHRRGLITAAALAAAERNLISAQLELAEALSAYREHWSQLLLLMGEARL